MTLQHISNTNYWKLSWLQKPEKLIKRTINQLAQKYYATKPFDLDTFESGNKLQELETGKSDFPPKNQEAVIRS